MMMRRFGFAALAMLCLTANALAAQILHRPSDGEPETLDPQKTDNGSALAIDRDLFVGLVTLSPTLQPIPGVAERWEVSADGLHWIFHLRSDAKWSNGDPLTASDFVYALQRLVDPKTAAADPETLARIVNAHDIVAGRQPDPTTLGVVASDPHTLEISLARPQANFLYLMSDPDTFPLHQSTVEKWGKDWTRPEHIVSNGPFVMVSWTPQSEIVLAKNPNFFEADGVKLDSVSWMNITDLQAGLRRFRSGELDLVRLNRDTIGWARANDPDELAIAPVNGSILLVFNMKMGTLAGDIRIREAINLAIDRELIVKRIDDRGEAAAYGIVSPVVPNYTAQSMPFRDQPMADRIARATSLMSAAGFTPDHPLKLAMAYPTSDATKQILTAIRHMLLPVGVELTLDNMEFQVFVTRLHQHDFEMAATGTQASYNDAEEPLSNYWSSAGVVDFSGYQSARFDALYGAGIVEMDTAKRRDDFEQAERVILTDYAFVPLEFNVSSFLVSTKLRGFVGDTRLPQSRFLSFKDPAPEPEPARH